MEVKVKSREHKVLLDNCCCSKNKVTDWYKDGSQPSLSNVLMELTSSCERIDSLEDD